MFVGEKSRGNDDRADLHDIAARSVSASTSVWGNRQPLSPFIVSRWLVLPEVRVEERSPRVVSHIFPTGPKN
jgi:hypothetical protein